MPQPSNDWKAMLGKLQEAMPPLEDEPETGIPEEPEKPEWIPGKKVVHIYTDSKKRKGKTVTVIAGIEAGEEILEKFGTQLKSLCGTGGSVKDGEILLQGDCKTKASGFLSSKGFKVKVR